MIQSKAIEIIKELNEKEFIQFGKYLASSVFTSNKNLPKLYSFLKKHYPSFSSENLTKENLYRSVYGDAGYNDAKTRKLLSDIFKEAEKFIVMLTIQVEKQTFNNILLRQFDARKLDNLFLAKYEEMSETLKNNKAQYSDFLDNHLLEWDNIQFHLERGMQYKIRPNTYKRAENLISFMLCDIFLSLQDITTFKNNYGYSHPLKLPETFISSINFKKLFGYIEKNNFPNKELVLSFYYAYEAFENFDDEKYYHKFKQYALRYIDDFHIGSQRTIIGFLINYCIRKKRISFNNTFEHELYGTYKLFLKYQLYKIKNENYIRSDFFFNIITYFYENGKVSELSGFIESNLQSIQPGHRKNIIALSSALIEFEKGNFGDSLRQASLIKSNTFIFKHKLKILILKNHYELGNLETALEASSNFRHFLDTDDEISALLKEGSYKFLHYYNILWKIYDGKGGKFNLSVIKKELFEGKQFPETKWIIKKFDELG